MTQKTDPVRIVPFVSVMSFEAQSKLLFITIYQADFSSPATGFSEHVLHETFADW